MEDTSRLDPHDDTSSYSSKLRDLATKIAFATSFFGIVMGALAMVLKHYDPS